MNVKTWTAYPRDIYTKVSTEEDGGLNMKWLILILLTQGNPIVLDHKPFDTEDNCVAWVSDLSNVQELAMEEVGFNNPVIGVYCITNQERKTMRLQKL